MKNHQISNAPGNCRGFKCRCAPGPKRHDSCHQNLPWSSAQHFGAGNRLLRTKWRGHVAADAL
jgi:hypothetical protein